jgi:hypothetical protein
MSLYSWFWDFHRRAYASKDSERIRLVNLTTMAEQVADDDPDRALGLLAEGRELAARLGEPWWVLYIDHWRTQHLLYRKQDYNAAREVVVPAVVEARKEQYERLPQRICLHEDLIRVYLGADPAGHAAQIAAALDYMVGQITPDLECRRCHQAMLISFAIESGRLDQAADAALRYLEISQHYDHHLAHAYASLCEVAYLRGDWPGLYGWAESGEPVAKRDGQRDTRAELLAWQALAAAQLGDQQSARRLYRSATSVAARASTVFDHWYYDALCAYQSLEGSYERALELRRRQLATLIDKGRTIDEFRCRLELCRLLSLLGQPLAADVAAARAVAGRLIDPAPALEQLERLESTTQP